MTILWTSIDEDAVTAWSELTNLLARVDGTDQFYDPEDLAEELHETGVDPALDLIAVWQSASLIAFGQLRVRAGLAEGRARASLGGGVHPEHRGRGIGRELMDRLERRAIELSSRRHPGIPVTLSAAGGLKGASVRPLLQHRGYRIVRYFHTMQRALPGAPLADAASPVELYRDEFSELSRLAHNEAFETHFGSTPHSPDEWHDGITSRVFRPECSVVIRDDAGAVLAYVMAYCYVPGELYIGRVGTVQRARGRGYARACLLASLRAGVEHGYTKVDLDVDSLNPTGAGALYESVGFHRRKTFAAYDKLVAPA